MGRPSPFSSRWLFYNELEHVCARVCMKHSAAKRQRVCLYQPFIVHTQSLNHTQIRLDHTHTRLDHTPKADIRHKQTSHNITRMYKPLTAHTRLAFHHVYVHHAYRDMRRGTHRRDQRHDIVGPCSVKTSTVSVSTRIPYKDSKENTCYKHRLGHICAQTPRIHT